MPEEIKTKAETLKLMESWYDKEKARWAKHFSDTGGFADWVNCRLRSMMGEKTWVSLRKPAVTIKALLSWEPCEGYTLERIEELFAGRKSLTPEEIAALDIPAEDKLWVLLREEILPAEVLHELACLAAERALQRERKAGREPDPRSWAAIEAKRAWLRGEIGEDELEVAWHAAWDVAANEAQCAAWVAAKAAAEASAMAAARAVAMAAAREAAWHTGSYVERAWQLARVLEVLP